MPIGEFTVTYGYIVLAEFNVAEFTEAYRKGIPLFRSIEQRQGRIVAFGRALSCLRFSIIRSHPTGKTSAGISHIYGDLLCSPIFLGTRCENLCDCWQIAGVIEIHLAKRWAQPNQH